VTAAAADRLILALAFLPYLALALFDGWLHEKARRVPKFEQALHALIAMAVITLLSGIFGGRSWLAWPALAVFVSAAAWDELGFHRQLAARERRLHYVAYLCFGGFVGVALWRGALAWN